VVKLWVRGILRSLASDEHGLMTTLLLFSGLHGESRGGAADLAGWYESETAGPAAFRELRGEVSDDEGWAELVVLDGRHRTRLLAWFGRSPSTHPAAFGRSVRRRHLRLVSR